MSTRRYELADEDLDEDGLPTHMPCPMGCGRFTEDVAGGPCETCWEAV